MAALQVPRSVHGPIAARPGSHSATRGAQPLLDVRAVTKRFGRVPAVRDVDVGVAAGEVVALVGENGAGKTTLVQCIARLVPLDGGLVTVAGEALAHTPAGVLGQGVGFVWQDFGLCDDLDVVSNLFLGRERGRPLLDEAGMVVRARGLLDQLGMDLPDLTRPVRELSRGQRQLVAIARVLLTGPRVLVLDEPTSSLGAGETRAVCDLLLRLRDAGTAILLITHDLELAFRLADRIAVLREGRVVANVSPAQVHTADVVALMAGVPLETAARRELRRLHSLVDQLSEAEPPASLPLIVSAMAAALDLDRLCVHLYSDDARGGILKLTAGVGLPAQLMLANRLLRPGPEAGCVGLAAETGTTVVLEDVQSDPLWQPFREAAEGTGIRSAWAAPIVGPHGLLGILSGYDTAVGAPRADQLELVSLYAVHAASAIERERLLGEVTRRNRVLESLRSLLEALAGPERIEGGLSVALLALCRGLGAREVSIDRLAADGGTARVTGISSGGQAGLRPSQAAAVRALLADTQDGRARQVAPGVAGAPLSLPDGTAALIAQWSAFDQIGADALELLEDAARSLALALEREALEAARQEAGALRRSQQLQRKLLSQLSHELRTPLTAIHGYASTLRQPDLTWDPASTDRFLTAIADESARMERLVGALLDSSAIESGLLRLRRDWCDLGLVLEAARACAPGGDRVTLEPADGLDAIWADHDRLEQVFLNLIENGLRHGGPKARVAVRITAGPQPQTVQVRVADDGPGISAEMAARIFEPRIRGTAVVPGLGLGLAIARGIVEAHGGTIALAPVPRGACFVVTLPTELPAGVEYSEEQLSVA